LRRARLYPAPVAGHPGDRGRCLCRRVRNGIDLYFLAQGAEIFPDHGPGQQPDLPGAFFIADPDQLRFGGKSRLGHGHRPDSYRGGDRFTAAAETNTINYYHSPLSPFY